MTTQLKENHYVPAVYVKDVQIWIRKEDWKITFSNKLWNFVSKPVVRMLRGFAIKYAASVLRTEIEDKLGDLINKEIL